MLSSRVAWWRSTNSTSAAAEAVDVAAACGRHTELSGSLESVRFGTLKMDGDAGDGPQPTDRHPRQRHLRAQQARRGPSARSCHPDALGMARDLWTGGEIGLRRWVVCRRRIVVMAARRVPRPAGGGGRRWDRAQRGRRGCRSCRHRRRGGEADRVHVPRGTEAHHPEQRRPACQAGRAVGLSRLVTQHAGLPAGRVVVDWAGRFGQADDRSVGLRRRGLVRTAFAIDRAPSRRRGVDGRRLRGRRRARLAGPACAGGRRRPGADGSGGWGCRRGGRNGARPGTGRSRRGGGRAGTGRRGQRRCGGGR